MFFSKINIERKCVMEEIKFESLNELFNRLYPAFNTKVCELKRSGINVSEVKLWNYLKEKNIALENLASFPGSADIYHAIHLSFDIWVTHPSASPDDIKNFRNSFNKARHSASTKKCRKIKSMYSFFLTQKPGRSSKNYRGSEDSVPAKCCMT